MKHVLRRALVIALLAGSAIGLQATAASAAGCTASAAKSQVETDVETGGSHGTCALVQARIDRYYASVIYIHLGPSSSSDSYVYAAEGVNAGNLWRGQPSGGSWSAWLSF